MAAAAYGLGGDAGKAKALVAKLTSLASTITAAEIEETFSYSQSEDRRQLANGLCAGGLQ